MIVCVLWVFAFGLAIGSFVNVMVARLPYEKSVFWPGSRCFACLRPIRLLDNMPIFGYLRLRGRCRFCRSPFSARYLWIELATGLAFVGLFLIEVVGNSHNIPALRFHMPSGIPSLDGWLYAAAHAYLLAMLIASGVIDAGYRIIPTHITYTGVLVGLVVSTLFPWPWPSGNHVVPAGSGWWQPQFFGKIPTGLALWPVWEPPTWAPAGSWQLGLLTGLAGAAAGMAVIRSLKFVFEFGFKQEAVGLGDADLLAMAGAFLGWQPVLLAVPVGAFVTLFVLPLVFVWVKLRGKSFPRHIPFGPGLAAGTVVVWLGWPMFGELVRSVFFQIELLGFGFFGMLGLLLIAGLVLRRT
jgi:leader peptidase (prepilin peptidase)/N-methyltransferase